MESLSQSVLMMGGRLVTCGGLVIRLSVNKKYRWADYQSAAVYQPAPHRKQSIAAREEF
jgi:hypothetical protein